MRNILRMLALIAAAALIMCGMPALAVQADTVTKQCTFEANSGNVKYLTDGKADTAWSPSASEAKLLINLPANGAGYVVIEWETEPTGYIFSQYDEQQGPIGAVNQSDTFGGMTQVFELDPEARYVVITLTRKEQAIAELSVYSAGDLPADMPRWSAPYVKTDIMLVCAYPGDEFVTFGGLLPYYSVKGENRVQLVYMTDTGRERLTENQAALWSLGMTAYPVYMRLSSSTVDSVDDCLSRWGGRDKLVGRMVEVIRQCKPEVIVSHDIGSADPRRRLTAMLMSYAIEAAADPAQYPESADVHGVWQVKKLYLQGGEGEVIDFDWSTPCEELGGISPIDSAATAFSCYESLRGKYAVTEVREDGDTSVYKLNFSMIGEDARHDCFFENVPSLDTYVADSPTPEPTVEPTPVPVLVFEPDPTATPVPGTGTVDEFAVNISRVTKFVGIGIGIIVLISCIQALSFRLRGRRKRRY